MATRYLNGLPLYHITTAAPAQQADFDEELSGLEGGGSLKLAHNKLSFFRGSEFISGIDENGSFRPKRFIFNLDIGPGAAAGEHMVVPVYATVDGTLVNLDIAIMGFMGAANPAINRDVRLPLSISPAVTVYGTVCCVDQLAGVQVNGTYSIDPTGLLSIYMGVVLTPWSVAAGDVIWPLNITYDTMKAW